MTTTPRQTWETDAASSMLKWKRPPTSPITSTSLKTSITRTSSKTVITPPSSALIYHPSTITMSSATSTAPTTTIITTTTARMVTSHPASKTLAQTCPIVRRKSPTCWSSVCFGIRTISWLSLSSSSSGCPPTCLGKDNFLQIMNIFSFEPFSSTWNWNLSYFGLHWVNSDLSIGNYY